MKALRKLHVCPDCQLVYNRISLYERPGCSVCGTSLVVLGFVVTQDSLDDEDISSEVIQSQSSSEPGGSLERSDPLTAW
jgi:hypothetical protein